MKNFNPRTMLWLIFASSLILLWSNYQASLAPKTAVQTTQNATANTGTASANAPSAASGTATPTGALSLSGQPLVLENDVLQLNINTQGGVVQYAMLKQFFNSKNHALNTVLFNSESP